MPTDADRFGDSARIWPPERSPSRLTTTAAAGTGCAAQSRSQPAGQRCDRNCRRHGDQHSAAQSEGSLQSAVEAASQIPRSRTINWLPMTPIQGPDFPTGGQIINTKDELREIYKTGQGAIKLRGTTKLVNNSQGKSSANHFDSFWRKQSESGRANCRNCIHRQTPVDPGSSRSFDRRNSHRPDLEERCGRRQGAWPISTKTRRFKPISMSI